MSDLHEIEDLEEAQVAALAALGLRTTDDLLAAGAEPAGRRRLARELAIEESHVLRWVNHADLHRVQGIGEQYADLLEEAGVDTVPELAQRNAANLSARLAEVNAERSLVTRLPTEAAVAGWIEHARQLGRVVVYRDAPGGAVETALGTVGPAEPAEVAAPAEPAAAEPEPAAVPAVEATVPVAAADGAASAATSASVGPAPASGTTEAALGFAGTIAAPAGELAAAEGAPVDPPRVVALPVEDVPAALEREAVEAQPVRAAFDGGVALPPESRPPRVGLTLDTSDQLPLLRLRDERAARTLWQRLLDRLGG